MTYAMSDIHGCYEKYMQMLDKIRFCEDDVLYVLGDVVDRGPQPVEILRDMSMRANVFPIMGNHESVAHFILSKILMLEVTSENIEKLFGTRQAIDGFVQDIQSWQYDGGSTTMQGFGKLDIPEREHLLEYLEEFIRTPALATEVEGKKFILTHAGLPKGATLTNFHKVDAYDFVMAQTDYNKQYFKDVFLVTGHRPTFVIDPAYRGKIYRKHNHIAIDTGACFTEKSGVLACICLETGEDFYV
jgi:serine/threonine protein phosphatase 1